MLSKPVKISTGGDFDTIPEGIYQVELADINLLENVVTTYAPAGKDMLEYKFVILDDTKLDGGESTRGRFLWARVTPSLNEKSTMAKLVKALLGKAPTPEEANAFDPSSLLGKQCQVVVVNNPSKDGTRVFSNIDNYLKASKQLPAFDGDLKRTEVVEGASTPVSLPKTDEEVDAVLGGM